MQEATSALQTELFVKQSNPQLTVNPSAAKTAADSLLSFSLAHNLYFFISTFLFLESASLFSYSCPLHSYQQPCPGQSISIYQQTTLGSFLSGRLQVKQLSQREPGQPLPRAAHSEIVGKVHRITIPNCKQCKREFGVP